jgi:type VI secretion system protein ImpH
MDTQARTTDAPIEALLFAEGERFSYFQAIRLLRRHARASGGNPESLRVRPRLGLGFPEADIDLIERLPMPARPAAGDQGAEAFGIVDASNAFEASSTLTASSRDLVPAKPAHDVLRVTANFFGLYGVASPLPSFYTEDLIEEEREGRRGTREFLDILHYSIYPLLFDGWLKYRPQVRIVEEGDADMLDHLYAFVGLDDRNVRPRNQPGVSDLLRYAGLFAQRPHSVLGLQTLLADAFAPARVEVVSCVEGWLRIPEDQRLVLGEHRHGLGVECYLGTQSRDSSNQLRIELRGLPEPLFRVLHPGQSEYERLRFLVKFYLIDPFEVTVLLELRAGDARPARAGGRNWNRLGENTWLAPPPDALTRPVTFLI